MLLFYFIKRIETIIKKLKLNPTNQSENALFEDLRINSLKQNKEDNLQSSTENANYKSSIKTSNNSSLLILIIFLIFLDYHSTSDNEVKF